MTPPLLLSTGAALLLSFAAVAAPATSPTGTACAATARRAIQDPRVQRAIDEAGRQQQLFGGQTIERNGSMFNVGHQEAEWSRPAGETVPTWARVAAFWRALSDAQPPGLMTSAGRIARAEAAGAVAGGAPAKADLAVRESLLRAAIVDTPWSAAFISYVVKSAGFTASEFAFSDSHVDYVQAAFEASEAEAAGRAPAYAYRACDVATTRPRAGDLLCATRASTAGTDRFDALATAMRTRAPGEPYPMHCDLVVRSDAGGDAKLESIGGNVVNSVTLTRMTLNARKVLSDAYIVHPAPGSDCAAAGQPCRGHLSRRPWLVLLQFRN